MDSALAAAFAGGSHWRGWTIDTMLLRGVLHATQNAVSRKKVKPVPLPSAVQRTKTVRVSSLAGMPGAVPRTERPTEEG